MEPYTPLSTTFRWLIAFLVAAFIAAEVLFIVWDI